MQFKKAIIYGKKNLNHQIIWYMYVIYTIWSYSRKKTKGGWLEEDNSFLKKKHLDIVYICDFTLANSRENKLSPLGPWKFCKIVWHTLKFHMRFSWWTLLEIPLIFHLTPALEFVHVFPSIYQYPWKFHVLNPTSHKLFLFFCTYIYLLIYYRKKLCR